MRAAVVDRNRLGALGAIGCGTVAAGAVLIGPGATAVVLATLCGVWFGWHVVQRPTLTAMTMVAVEVTNLSGVAAAYISAPIVQGSLALGVVAVALALRQPDMRGRLNRGTAACVGLVAIYLFTEMLAVLGSQDVVAALSVLTGSVLDCAFLIVVLVLVQMSRDWWAIAGSVVIPLAVLSVLTVVNQLVFGGTQSFGGLATVTEASGELVTTLRFGGPLPDSNFWGRHLVLGLPFAAALLVRALRRGGRAPIVGWAAAVVALLAGVYLTQSRGSFIAAGVALAVWVIASGPAARRRGVKSLPLLALVLLTPGVGNRLVALVADVARAGSTYVIDLSVLERMAAQEIAWAMFRDRPWFGFGPGAYPLAVPHYAGFVDTAVLNPTDGAHNLYAGIAAESGIVGLTGWAVMVLGFTVCIGQRMLRIPPERMPAERALAAAALAAIVGWSTASVFLHLAYFRTFAICLAFAGALGSSVLPGSGPRGRLDRKRTHQIALASVLGVAAAAGVAAVAPAPAHTTVSQRVTLLPTPQMSGYYAYALDIRTRSVVLPTYAALIAAGQPDVMAVADTVRGVIDVSVSAADPAAASAALNAALIQGQTNLAALQADSWYSIVPVGSVSEQTEHGVASAWILAAVIVGATTVAGTRLLQRRGRQRPGIVGARYRQAAGTRRQKVSWS